MPLLTLEPFVYPADLLSGQEREGAWWAVHTRPRAEKALARQLLEARVAFFLPLHGKEHRCVDRGGRTGRLRHSYLPLFPGYLFLHGDDDARTQALKTNQVSRLLPVSDVCQLRADLARVWRVMEGGEVVSPEPVLEPGTRVRITSGSLEGLEGTVVRRGRKLHFVIEVQFLRQGVSVEVPSSAVRPVEAHARRRGD